ncbi:D-alanyl-D-alanine carboxypeptidase family protein [Pontibacillus yanchengensis]|uniref:Peptidase M15 n=1 Tax=Pontibacillus yanchengensis Y32 TaxID=1385514 RepID=A0A0A2TTW6_9BACI|nr:D-alanyl-D-alanine carboxypeptidase family protein [Pontibacillus yanchengensis]KGP72710.1 peptidase M15 [Pontibacillus yanchengensis Y32]
MKESLKKIGLVVAASCFTVAPWSSSFAQADAKYNDLSEDVTGYEEIQFLSNKNIIKGYPDSSFRPGDDVTRMEAAIMLTRALDLSTKNRPDPNLNDISKDHPHYEYVATVVDEGIYQGTPSNQFLPSESIKRIDMAAVLTRAYELESGPITPDFRDVADDRQYMTKVVSNGISVGFPNQTFRPDIATTRAQFSIFLARTMDDQFKNPTVSSNLLEDAEDGKIRNCFAPLNQEITYEEFKETHGSPEKRLDFDNGFSAEYGKCTYSFNGERPQNMFKFMYFPKDERLTKEKMTNMLGEPDRSNEQNNSTINQIYELEDYTVKLVYPYQENVLHHIEVMPNHYLDPTWLLQSEYINNVEQVNGKPVIQNPENQLALVNKDNYLPSSYTPELVRPKVDFVFGDQKLNKALMRPEAANHLEELFNAAAEDGINILATSGYRSYERQQTLFQQEVEESGREAAEEVVAIPGSSEHQSGLAMDITSPSVDYHLVQRFGDTEAGQWLEENAYKYGFILRYPQGKKDVTGYQYEPWHFRYVGKAYAEIIHNNNITLEEYFQSITEI